LASGAHRPYSRLQPAAKAFRRHPWRLFVAFARRLPPLALAAPAWAESHHRVRLRRTALQFTSPPAGL